TWPLDFSLVHEMTISLMPRCGRDVMHVTKKLFVRTSRRAAIVPNYGHMLQLEFVSGANREKYREFCGNRPSTSISMPSRRAKINRFPEFPTQRNREFTKSYQGIFLTVTGNRAQWAESRSAFCDQRKNSSV